MEHVNFFGVGVDGAGGNVKDGMGPRERACKRFAFKGV